MVTVRHDTAISSFEAAFFHVFRKQTVSKMCTRREATGMHLWKGKPSQYVYIIHAYYNYNITHLSLTQVIASSNEHIVCEWLMHVLVRQQLKALPSCFKHACAVCINWYRTFRPRRPLYASVHYQFAGISTTQRACTTVAELPSPEAERPLTCHGKVIAKYCTNRMLVKHIG